MAIWRLERAGHRGGRWPAKQSLQQLVEFYGVSADELFPIVDIQHHMIIHRPPRKVFGDA